MTHIFTSHSEFKDWFANPLMQMVEGGSAINHQLVNRLHSVLRPFILRRLKKDVETQMPGKHEHIVECPLSKARSDRIVIKIVKFCEFMDSFFFWRRERYWVTARCLVLGSCVLKKSPQTVLFKTKQFELVC